MSDEQPFVHQRHKFAKLCLEHTQLLKIQLGIRWIRLCFPESRYAQRFTQCLTLDTRQERGASNMHKRIDSCREWFAHSQSEDISGISSDSNCP